MRRSGGRALGVLAAGLVVGVSACTGGTAPDARRAVATAGAGGAVASGAGGWQRLALLAGTGPETAVEVTGLATRAAGGPWLAVGAARSGAPPQSIGTPATVAAGQSSTGADGGTLAPAVWTSAARCTPPR